MENRVIPFPRSARRPSAAFGALVLVIAITMVWWALAFWPAGTGEPEWLARTRLACFGSINGGMPDAGGWVLLIGEPIGMLAVLAVVWGHALRRDLKYVRAAPRWRLPAAVIAAVTLAGVVSLGVLVARQSAHAETAVARGPGVITRLDLPPPPTSLIDQHGTRVSLADLRGRPSLLTVAFGHCATVCPAVVDDLRRARQAAGRGDVRLVVLTVDPWRDTPERLPSLAEHWALGSGDRVLSGSVAEVEQVLDSLGIGRRRNEKTGDIEHGGTVMLVNARGRLEWRIDGGWDRVAELLR